MRISTTLCNLAAFAVACSNTPPSPTDAVTPGAQQLTGAVVVDAHETPTGWTPDRGEAFVGAAHIVGDVTGDGLVDGVVQLMHADDPTYDAYIVPGPLRRGYTLPGAELATVTDVLSVAYAGDVDGDGDLDLLADIGAWAFKMLPGPFEGVLPAPTTGWDAPLGGSFGDLNGDRVFDWAGGHYDPETSTRFIDVTYGPITSDELTPDFSVRVGCEGFVNDDLQTGPLLGLPDVTGDGVRDLWLGISTTYGTDACNALFSMPEAGETADPEHDAEAVFDVPPMQRVPDQTGDGLDDVLLTRSRAVAPAPVMFADGALVGSSFAFDAELDKVWSAGVDLTGDGVADFLGYAETYDLAQDPMAPFLAAAMVVVPGGEDGIATRSFDTVYDVFYAGNVGPAGLSDVFVEDGVASVLVTYGDRVSVLDLGPAY